MTWKEIEPVWPVDVDSGCWWFREPDYSQVLGFQSAEARRLALEEWYNEGPHADRVWKVGHR